MAMAAATCARAAAAHARPGPRARARRALARAGGGEGGEENVYEAIRRQRAERRRARKAAAREADAAAAASREAVGRGEAASSSRAQDGDEVRFTWAVRRDGDDRAVDGTERRGQPDGRKMQLGTYTGFQQKSGLDFAFSEMLCGLRVGETTQVVVRADKGWFGSTTANAYTAEGAFLQTLNIDEQKLPWAQEGEVTITLELLALQPPAGRKLSDSENSAWNSGWQQVERRPKA